MTERKESRKKTLQPCFHLGGQMYVPTIDAPGYWVTFGGRKIKTQHELMTLRAKISHESLYVQEAPYDWISKIKVGV